MALAEGGWLQAQGEAPLSTLRTSESVCIGEPARRLGSEFEDTRDFWKRVFLYGQLCRKGGTDDRDFSGSFRMKKKPRTEE